jgi:plasmid stabilization system protein ParE
VIVEWSERATAELQAARDFIARSSPGYAQVVAERVVRRTEELADQPLIGAEVPEYGDENLREVYEHPYRILYRVTADRVQVVAVVHSARQLPRHPPG